MEKFEIKLNGTQVIQTKVKMNNDKTFCCVLLPLSWNNEVVTVIANPINIDRLL